MRVRNLLLIWMGIVFGSSSSQAQFGPTLIEQTGDQILGGTINNLTTPTVNNAGQVLYTADVTSVGSMVLLNNTIMARTGTAAPSGGNFSNVSTPSILNDSGTIGLIAGLSGGTSTSGIFVGTSTLALTSTAAPEGGNYSSFGSHTPRMNEAGEVFFGASLTGGSAASGLFFGTPGNVQTVALEGTAAPSGGNYSSLSTFLQSASLNNQGQVAFRSNLTGGTAASGVFSGTAGVLETVALRGGAAPSGGNYFNFNSGVAINDAGQIAFQASLSSAGNTNAGIYVGTPGAMERVARSGTAAPEGGNYNLISPTVAINSAGQVAFQSSLSGGETGLFLGTPDSVTTVAISGSAAPSGDGATFASFSNAPALNKHGQVAFLATLEGTGVTTANDTALYAGTPGSLVEVVREGDVIDGRTVTRITFDIGSNVNPTGGEDGLRRAFTDTGFITYELRFTPARRSRNLNRRM